jgi:hypothetical protein
MLKYSANPDKYGSHERILSLLQELPAGSSVLDVGSAIPLPLVFPSTRE